VVTLEALFVAPPTGIGATILVEFIAPDQMITLVAVFVCLLAWSLAESRAKEHKSKIVRITSRFIFVGIICFYKVTINNIFFISLRLKIYLYEAELETRNNDISSACCVDQLW
jgi:hypothetical protein